MVLSGQACRIRTKGVVFGHSGCIRQSGSFRAKVVLIGQKWLYSGKNGCIPKKQVVFGQKGLWANGDCDITEK